MNYPEGRTQEGDILEEDTFTLVEVDKLWTHTILRSKYALGRAFSFFIIHGNTILTIFQHSGTTAFVLGRTFSLITKSGITNPGPPGVSAATTIDGTLTGDGDVLGFEGIDTGRDIEAFQTFPRGFYDGVELRFESELQHSPFLYFEVDATLQLDGTCQEFTACRHYHLTATFL